MLAPSATAAPDAPDAPAGWATTGCRRREEGRGQVPLQQHAQQQEKCQGLSLPPPLLSWCWGSHGWGLAVERVQCRRVRACRLLFDDEGWKILSPQQPFFFFFWRPACAVCVDASKGSAFDRFGACLRSESWIWVGQKLFQDLPPRIAAAAGRRRRCIRDSHRLHGTFREPAVCAQSVFIMPLQVLNPVDPKHTQPHTQTPVRPT